MSVEESWALPLVEKYVTAKEWNAMAEDAAAGLPQEKLPLLVGMLMYEGDPQVIQQTLSHIPQDFRSVIKDEAPKAFKDHSRLIYGTPNPPRSTSFTGLAAALEPQIH